MMKLVKCAEISHLIPQESYYQHENYKDEWVLYHEGDLTLDKPINLDNTYAYFFPEKKEEEIFVFFVLVTGNLKAGNIFNDETDSCTGLVILGDLTANNIVVGGQGIFVTGNLLVDQLFWGDYNHGDLQVVGAIKAKVFINTDYGVDYQRFQNNENIFIDHLLWDGEEDDYDEETYIRSLIRPEYLLSDEDLEDEEIYSWKDRISISGFLKAIAEEQPVLQDNLGAYKSPEDEVVFFFEDLNISKENLVRFTESDILVSVAPKKGETAVLEYWDGLVFRRVYTEIGSPEKTAVYFQYEEKFACMVYLYEEPNMFNKLTGNKKYALTKAFKIFPEDKWLVIDADAPQEIQEFLKTQWDLFLWKYSEMIHLKKLFRENITREKMEAILNLPIAQEMSKLYYTDDASQYIGYLHLQFRLEDPEEEYGKRISIIRQEPSEDDEDHFDFYHFDLVETIDGRTAPVLFTQDSNDYESEIYEVLPIEVNKYRKALRYWRKLEQNIEGLNEEFLNGELSLTD